METSQKKRLKGIYLVPDPLMLKPHLGASEHIKAGFQELQKHFDIELVVLGDFKPVDEKNSRVSVTRGRATKNGFVGLLRDLKLLYKSNRNRSSLAKMLKGKKGIDFIYERGQYLDLRGLYAARKLGLSHFYEVNWLNFLGIRQFYTSWFNALAKKIEEHSYNRSALNFFIGTQHKLIDIFPEKVCTIQNGIAKTIIISNADHRNIVKGKVRMCFVANLLAHHEFGLLTRALQECQVADKIELHLIGYNFESVVANIPPAVEVILHGPVKKENLLPLIAACNIGLISGGPSYSSFMKLFEYAAHKLCVICPELENVQLMFDASEIAYFKRGDATSLANQLRNLCARSEIIPEFGENIYSKVAREYTWEHIYDGVAEQIRGRVTA